MRRQILGTGVRRGITAWALVVAGAVAPMGSIAARSAVLVQGPFTAKAVNGHGLIRVYQPVVAQRLYNPLAHRLSVERLSPYCTADVKLASNDFTASPDLSVAKLKKNTPCGLVSMTWKAVGPIIPGAALYREAVMTGYVGSTYFPASDQDFALIILAVVPV